MRGVYYLMISEKTTLQEKFNTVPGVAVNRLLKFNNNGELEAVSISAQGILPQIKVIATAGYIVTCKKNVTGASLISASANYPANTWFFNVPELANYIVSVQQNASSTATNYSVTVSDYKQYTVNAN